MADSQSIVDQIRAFLAATDQTNSPQLGELATEYAALCAQANARLSKSADYLKKGLRSEAIQLAEDPPILLELVSALDLPEAQEWAGVCAMYALARPPVLLMDAAQQLNEAYGIEQPMQALLNRHRRYALELAPLTDRIKVLRELAKADTTSPVWKEDVQTFETARLREIKIEATQSIKARNREVLSALLAEINAPDWSVPIPADTRKAIEGFETVFGQEQAQVQVRELANQLDAAFGAMDLPGAKKLLAQINTLTRERKLALPPEVIDQIEPAEDWINQQRAKAQAKIQIDAAMTELLRAMDQDQPAEQVQQLRAQAGALGASVPGEVDDRIRAMVIRQRDAHRRKVMMGYAALVAAVALIAGIGLVVARNYSRNQAGVAAVARMRHALDDKNLDQASEELALVQKDQPYVLDRPDFTVENDRLSSLLQERKDARDNFKKAEHGAQSEIELAKQKASPNPAYWEPAHQAVAQLRTLAKSADELRKVDVLDSEVAKEIADLRSRTDGENKKQVADLEASTTALLARDDLQTADDPQLNSVLKNAVSLREKMSDRDASDPAVREVADAVDRLQSLQSRLKLAGAEQSALAHVIGSASTSHALVDALNDYCTQLPDSGRTAHFSEAMKSASLWIAAEEGEKLAVASNLAGRPVANTITDRIAAINQYLSEHTESPLVANLKTQQSYLTAAEPLGGEQGEWAKNLVSVYEDQPLFTDKVKYLQTNTGACYYFNDSSCSHMVSEGQDYGYSFTPILSADTEAESKSPKKHLGVEDVKAAPALTPQYRLIKKMRAAVAAGNGDGVSLGFDLMNSIISAGDVDPVLRVILLHKALVTGGAKIPWDGSTRLTDVATELENTIKLDSTPWMDAEKPVSVEARPKAVEVLAKVQSRVAATAAKIQSRFAANLKSFEPRIAGHGVLLLKPDGNWKIDRPPTESSIKLPEGTHVYLAGSESWVSVGTLKNGKFEIDGSGLNPKMEGTMVFIRPGAE